jgi:DNA-binding Lrp family transcriptional regulator
VRARDDGARGSSEHDTDRYGPSQAAPRAFLSRAGGPLLLRGAQRKMRPLTDVTDLAMAVTAVVLIKAKTDQIAELAQALAELDGVSEVFSVAGRYDLVAIVRAARNEDLAEIVSQKMHKVQGIVDSETLIAFRVYKSAEIEAAFALGLED